MSHSKGYSASVWIGVIVARFISDLMDDVTNVVPQSAPVLLIVKLNTDDEFNEHSYIVIYVSDIMD